MPIKFTTAGPSALNSAPRPSPAAHAAGHRTTGPSALVRNVRDAVICHFDKPEYRATVVWRRRWAYGIIAVRGAAMTTTQTNLTADDLWRMPDDGMRHELIRGELTMMTPAGGGHGKIAMRLGSRLERHVEAKHLGEVVAAETGFIIARNPDTLRAPDAAFISKEHVPAGGLPDGFIPLAPDIAVEVMSPSDSVLDVEEKIEQWLTAGTAMVWVVNPRGRMVTVHRSGRDPRILRGDDRLEGEDVCPGFSVKISELF
jgi:Uma2 family endonuclease